MSALWDLRCVACGHLEPNVACSMFAIPDCPSCGGERRLTDAAEYHPFIPYFDVALGVQVNSLAERWQHMKPEIDHQTGETIRGRLDYREKMRPGELSARRDRVEERRKQQRLGNSA